MELTHTDYRLDIFRIFFEILEYIFFGILVLAEFEQRKSEKFRHFHVVRAS